MRLLIDQNVPDSVAQFFRERGHEVSLVRETLGRAAPDQLIAVTAELQGVIVVSFDKDFRRFQKLVPEGHRKGFVAGAGLIHLAVKETRGVARLRDEIAMIEFYAARAAREGKLVRIRLTETTIQLAMAGGRVRQRPQ
jgi:hypothetical protein